MRKPGNSVRLWIIALVFAPLIYLDTNPEFRSSVKGLGPDFGTPWSGRWIISWLVTAVTVFVLTTISARISASRRRRRRQRDS